jgi:sec-independent protein translocase protein TatA
MIAIPFGGKADSQQYPLDDCNAGGSCEPAAAIAGTSMLSPYRMSEQAGLTREAVMGEFSPWHLLIVLAVFVLLFGANKLPQMARSVGQSMRIFKAETRALSGEKDPGQLPSTAASTSPSTETPQPHHQDKPPTN